MRLSKIIKKKNLSEAGTEIDQYVFSLMILLVNKEINNFEINFYVTKYNTLKYMYNFEVLSLLLS